MHTQEHIYDKADEIKPVRRLSNTYNTAIIIESEDPIIESNEEGS